MSDVLIVDPTTNHRQMVNNTGHSCVAGYQESSRYAAIVDYQQGYVARISRTPTGADDEFFYLYNGASDDLIIDRIVITDAGAENVKLAVCTGTPAGGTALVPVNLYAGSANTFALKSASNVCESGVDITDLTLGATLDTIVTGAGTTVDRNYEATPRVVPTGQAVCLSAVTGTTAIVADVYFHYAMEPLTE